MNYYERHLGDYARDTAHLTMLEHGAYTLLIDRYYATEKGIPADQAHRICRARSREERAAVDSVLAEFFSESSGVWIHKRCDEMIAAFNAGEPEREAKKSNEKARLQRHREERAALFQQLNAAGQHADWNIKMSALRELVDAVSATGKTSDETQTVTAPETAPETFQVTASATPATATHTPIPKHQNKKIARKRALPPDFAISERVESWAAAKGYSRLPERFDHFVSYAKRSGKTYADWDEALMSAIREDWAKLGGTNVTPFARRVAV